MLDIQVFHSCCSTPQPSPSIPEVSQMKKKKNPEKILKQKEIEGWGRLEEERVKGVCYEQREIT